MWVLNEIFFRYARGFANTLLMLFVLFGCPIQRCYLTDFKFGEPGAVSLRLITRLAIPDNRLKTGVTRRPISRPLWLPAAVAVSLTSPVSKGESTPGSSPEASMSKPVANAWFPSPPTRCPVPKAKGSIKAKESIAGTKKAMDIHPAGANKAAAVVSDANKKRNAGDP